MPGRNLCGFPAFSKPETACVGVANYFKALSTVESHVAELAVHVALVTLFCAYLESCQVLPSFVSVPSAAYIAFGIRKTYCVGLGN